jgi:phytanoyl-CoA hydroxylase
MLSTEQNRFYQENGYLHVRGLLTAAEAAFYRQELHELAERLGERDATWSSVRSGEPGKRTRLMHCHDVQFYSAAFTSLLVDPRFTRIAQGIVGPNVQLHHTKMFIKPPENGSPFPMHQDYPYFPHQHHSMIAAMIPAKAGDAIFMSYLLVHGSGLNRSNEPRTTILVQMRDPEDIPLNNKHSSRGQGMMLAGIDPRRPDHEFAWERKAE